MVAVLVVLVMMVWRKLPNGLKAILSNSPFTSKAQTVCMKI